MHNLVLLLMGGVGFISFKNNKKILLKNIFFQKDVDLNSKKQCGVIFPFWMKSLGSKLAPFLVSSPSCPLMKPGCAAGSPQAGNTLAGLFQGCGQLACSENPATGGPPSCSSKDRISCLWFSPEDADPKGTAFTDSNQVLGVWSEVA